MAQVKVFAGKRVRTHEVKEGINLLQFLRQEGYEIVSPCGGNGVCGKCLAEIKGVGRVTSCIYQVTNDIEVILPDEWTATVISSQSNNTIYLPFDNENFYHLSKSPFGVAIDIGTTSLVFYFVNLITGMLTETKAILNPQAKYGADVISRINYSAAEPNGLKQLQLVLIETINRELAHFISGLEITPDDIVKINVAGNTTMLHLLLSVDPLPIALAPFKPVFTEGQIRKGSDLELTSNPDASIKILPSLSAYVGADIIAGIAALNIPEGENHLFIDIGTNGEMALIMPDKIIACATAAGPAFEGANISCGMAAVEGAVSAYGEDGYRTVANSMPAGICGSGLVDLVAWVVKNNLVKSDGFMQDPFIIAQGVELTPADIREVQLAKSAVFSGIKILLKEAGLTYDKIGNLYLAGGFGNYINPVSAAEIGLIPKELLRKVIQVGNTSGAGALLSLRSSIFDERILQILSKSAYIELSTHDDFPLEFAMNMNF